ncbi:ABC transporter ATP-binding protein [Methanolobus halotolerans]|uniref:Molybdenum ABC transporter ATP-binding protein n=1 Tax=Methanolobus halotolerans TaxID=2052935 RepID=A0A4E0QCA3_9EURY|nr:ATP-binding cassette domain-containing protein [Methanolobus halotolerans]TGC10907.1 molybdenum ABC transporter ATP-binding protein [Methanolobus halotolerans]
MPPAKKMTEPEIPLIEMRNVTVSRNDRNILDSVDLKINRGENIALIGPNGSGKSSLIKVITGDYRPRADSRDMVLRIMGKQTWNIFDLRDLMGIVSGDLQFEYNRDINGFEVVLSGFFSSIGIYPNHNITLEMVRTAYELMEFLGISGLSDKLISEMSTGEARRTLVGRALVHEPHILVLDEPANSLDMKSHHQFRELTRKIVSCGKSIVLVTHDLDDIIPEIGRVVLLKDGKVFADGRKEEILSEENLSGLFGLPVKLTRNKGYYHATY